MSNIVDEYTKKVATYSEELEKMAKTLVEELPGGTSAAQEHICQTASEELRRAKQWVDAFLSLLSQLLMGV